MTWRYLIHRLFPHRHVPTTAQPSPSPTPVPSISPAPSTATPSAKPTTAQPTLSSGSRSSGSDGAVFVFVGAAGAVFLAILLACLFGFVWRKKRSARVAPMGEAPAPAPAPAPACGTAEDVFASNTPAFELHTPEAPAPPAPFLATVTPEAARPAPEAPARPASRFWLAWRSARAFTRPAPETPAQPPPEAAPPPARETASRIWLAWRRARARNADEVFAEIARLLRRPASVHPTTPSGP